jgi:hypothetical protein
MHPKPSWSSLVALMKPSPGMIAVRPLEGDLKDHGDAQEHVVVTLPSTRADVLRLSSASPSLTNGSR